MLVFLRTLTESFVLALQELWTNKLRTFLSMLGITIGIFCVVSVLMMLDSIEKNVKSSFNKLGEDVVYIDRFPWNEDPDANWWKYIRRPLPSEQEYEYLKNNLQTADAISIRTFHRADAISYRNQKIEDINYVTGTHDFGKIAALELAQGRYFSPQESALGNNVVILGYALAQSLFPRIGQPIGKEIELNNRSMRVVGILEEEGKSLLGDGFDKVAIIPYNYQQRYAGKESNNIIIAVKAKSGISINQLKDEVTGQLRAKRKLRPGTENNFHLNQLSILTNIIDQVFGVINAAGWLIGAFAILVGGFGIANIMFVSVKERTNLIGIKKSLGAKNYFILFEFLIEAIYLCLLGGGLGILLVYLLSLLGNAQIAQFDLVLSQTNILIGISLSLIIGIAAGLIPAFNAARLDPVEAIRK